MAALGRRSFWASTAAAVTAIQVTLMTPSATIISMSPMLEPTQHSPNSSPDVSRSRHISRLRRFSGVSS